MSIVTAQYARAHALITENRAALAIIAEALLIHEVLDGEQVRRLAAGGTLAEVGPPPAAAVPASADEEQRARQRARASIVPPLQPIQNPVPQQ